MYFCHEISILCIFVVAFQNVQCSASDNLNESQNVKKNKKTKPQNINDDVFKVLGPAPEGYHFELYSQVVKNHKPGTYQIMTMDQAVNLMAKQKQLVKSKGSRHDGNNTDDHDDEGHGDEGRDNKGQENEGRDNDKRDKDENDDKGNNENEKDDEGKGKDQNENDGNRNDNEIDDQGVDDKTTKRETMEVKIA